MTPREQELLGDVQEKDAQLQMAAELGQSLVARTEALEIENEALVETSCRQEVAAEEHAYRIDELLAETARLHEIINGNEAELSALRHDTSPSGPSRVTDFSAGSVGEDGADGRNVGAVGAELGSGLEIARLGRELAALDQEKATEAHERGVAQRRLKELVERYERAENAANMAQEEASARAAEQAAQLSEVQRQLEVVQEENRQLRAQLGASELALLMQQPSETSVEEGVPFSAAPCVERGGNEKQAEEDDDGGGGVCLLDEFMEEQLVYKQNSEAAEAEIRALKQLLADAHRPSAALPPSAATPAAVEAENETLLRVKGSR